MLNITVCDLSSSAAPAERVVLGVCARGELLIIKTTWWSWTMYAVVKIQDRQFRVEPEAVLCVPLLDSEIGATVSFDEVLLTSDGNEVKVGAPHLAGCSVTAEVVRHGLASKIVVFKKKRRKNYRRRKGHRQPFTEVRVKQIIAS
jgi:large subunit ribosomal protein L21